MVKFKDFSRHLSVFQELFKANLIFKDFSTLLCIFKYFQACANLGLVFEGSLERDSPKGIVNCP